MNERMSEGTKKWIDEVISKLLSLKLSNATDTKYGKNVQKVFYCYVPTGTIIDIHIA